MRRTNLLSGVIFFTIAAALMGAGADTTMVTVTGAGATPGEWTVDRVKKELAADITKIDYSGHDGKHTSTAVPLISLLKAAGAPGQLTPPPKDVDPKAKHAEMHYAVMVTGRDGYFAVFSISELMPDLGNRHVWLALDADGKAWPDAEAPMKLIVPDDEKPARWVHAIQTISLVKVEPPATQPVH